MVSFIVIAGHNYMLHRLGVFDCPTYLLCQIEGMTAAHLNNCDALDIHECHKAV